VASPIAGRLDQLMVKRGDQVAVNARLYALEAVSEAAAQRQAQEQVKAAEAQLADLRSGRRPPEQDVTRAQLAQAEVEVQRTSTNVARDEAQFRIGGIPRPARRCAFGASGSAGTRRAIAQRARGGAAAEPHRPGPGPSVAGRARRDLRLPRAERQRQDDLNPPHVRPPHARYRQRDLPRLAMATSDYFKIIGELPDEEAGRAALAQGVAQFVVSIPPDFTRKLLRGERPSILLEADASDPTATSAALAASSRC
jgi:pyruvate/2-oxoglutarate dehydrogenase complex dihydrolipoamide acyltransferase (E2) component